MTSIVLRGHIVVPRPDLPAVVEALPRHIELTRAEPGCLVFEVTQDATDPFVFHVYEQFIDRAAFEHHQARVHASDWGAMTQGVERFYTVSGDRDD